MVGKVGRIGKLGKVGKVGTVGGVGLVGKVGKAGKVGKLGKVGKEGKVGKIGKVHCKSDGGKNQTCFTKLESKTVKIYFFICYLTIQLVKFGGFFNYWLGFQGVSHIGWYSKYTC